MLQPILVSSGPIWAADRENMVRQRHTYTWPRFDVAYPARWGSVATTKTSKRLTTAFGPRQGRSTKEYGVMRAVGCCYLFSNWPRVSQTVVGQEARVATMGKTKYANDNV